MRSFILLFVVLNIYKAFANDRDDRDRSYGVTFNSEAPNKIVHLLSEINRKIESCACKQNCRCQNKRLSDCSDLDRGSRSGIYKIYPNNKDSGFDVYCSVDNHGNGWTVFQRRMNGDVNFYRNWKSYKNGFGSLKDEFWLGNDHLNQITRHGTYMLRVELGDFEDNTRYAQYKKFTIGPESSGYKLSIGGYSGDAGNALGRHNGMKFSTKDKDNDVYSGGNCATKYKGGWWYDACHDSNLNGPYLNGKHKSYADGMEWRQWKGYHYSMKTTIMMVRKV